MDRKLKSYKKRDWALIFLFYILSILIRKDDFKNDIKIR